MKFNADILRKYLTGKFSLNDKIAVDEFFENSHHSTDLDDVLKEYWGETLSRPVENIQNLDSVLDKINHYILLKTSNPSRIRRVWQVYSRVAAILLFPVLLFAIYYLNSDNNHGDPTWVEVHSPYGARTQFSLPDGSTGWLNGGSVVKYPVRFGSIRNVILNGEAYFDVIKNPKSPLIVDANNLKIKVLGTSFNVISYKGDSISEVIVAEGKVNVTAKYAEFNEILLPSDHLALNTVRNTYSKKTSNVLNYTSWRTGKLTFVNDKLDEVIRKLSRFYNVDFDVKENVDRNQLFRANFEEENLDEILRYLKITMDIDYFIQEREVDRDHNVSKRKIIITGTTPDKY
ncbi:MAG: FecR family protein [Mangrovibacterium sp.]